MMAGINCAASIGIGGSPSAYLDMIGYFGEALCYDSESATAATKNELKD